MDRIAVNPLHELLAISVAGPGMRIKAFAALLHSGLKAEMNATDLELQRYRLSRGEKRELVFETVDYLANITVLECGYKTYRTKLAHGWSHLVAIANDPTFVPCLSDDVLWNVLTGPMVTTPLLRSWIPWIREQMTEREMLVPAYCHGCKAGQYLVTTEAVDRLVADGIRSGALVISI